MINVCVNLVSSRVAMLWNFTKFNSAIDFSELKTESTYLPTYPPMKTDGSGDTENSEVHFKVVRGEIPTQMGFSCAASRTALTIDLFKLRAESWGLPVGEWGGGRLCNWLEVEVVFWVGEFKGQRKFF